MSNKVYANNREISCKAGVGKSIAAFPDVCFTPPQSPATPPGIPVPYPNTGLDSDTSRGSRRVKISRKEVMLKNKSYFKKTLGDEAGCAPKKGVITSVNRGKAYFVAWSMDVKIEGQNVVRHLDMTTHNHASPNANTPPQIFAARMAMANLPGCQGELQKVKDACGEKGEKFSCPDVTPFKNSKKARKAAKDKHGVGSAQYKAANKNVDAAMNQMVKDQKADPCRKKMRCLLSPLQPNRCCPGQTPHHLVEAGAFYDEGRGGITKKPNVKIAVFKKSFKAATQVAEVSGGPGEVISRPIFGAEKYEEASAPCICCEGESQNQGTHKLLHQSQDKSARKAPEIANPNPFNPLRTQKGEKAKLRRLDNAISSGADAVAEVFPESGCDRECIEAQLKDYHYNKAKMNPELPIKAADGQGKALPSGTRS